MRFRSLRIVAVTGLLLAAALATAGRAPALTIELDDVAGDRIERQRAYTVHPEPLPETPDTSKLADRLAAKGLKSGSPILLRVFKAESKLELWIEKDATFVLFDTYPICNWSGTLGPKLKEGDRQTPEGFYTITSRQLHRVGRWKHALNLGFPNAFDESLERDGSYILIHGGCSSSGCFAMTDPVIMEIFNLTSAALKGGQYYVPVHVFPFRMTDENIAKQQASAWQDFWSDLKQGYDAFEATRRPPRVSVCEHRYRVRETSAAQVAAPEEKAASSRDKRRNLSFDRIRVDCTPTPPAAPTNADRGPAPEKASVESERTYPADGAPAVSGEGATPVPMPAAERDGAAAAPGEAAPRPASGSSESRRRARHRTTGTPPKIVGSDPGLAFGPL